MRVLQPKLGSRILVLALGVAWLLPTVGVTEEQKPAAVLLYERFVALRKEINALDTEIESLEQAIDLVDEFACPPGTPNKLEYFEDLAKAEQRQRLTYREIRLIKDRRTYLGRIGEDQVRTDLFGGDVFNLDGYIKDEDIAIAERNVTRLRSALSALRRKLANKPKTEQDCNPQIDPITGINFNAPTRRPGVLVNARVTGTTQSGRALNITNISVSGLEAITDGSRGVTGVGIAGATVDFRIADVRRHGPFPVTITITGTPRVAAGEPVPPPASLTRTFNYTVANAEPTIAAAPDDPEADPGKQIALSGRIVVVDTNADQFNSSEVSPGNISIKHPAGLRTTPATAFDSFSTIRLVKHDAKTGTFTFNVTRQAPVKRPHEHGEFETVLTAQDSKGASVSKPVVFTVNNVAPTAHLDIAPKRNFHSNDGLKVVLSGWVEDDNGTADIERIAIDATEAGGAKYALTDGTVVTRRASDVRYEFTVKPSDFAHTNNPGDKPIKVIAADGGAPEQNLPDPLTVDFSSSIHVGNKAPEVGGIGYIYGNDTTIVQQRRLCPNDPYRVGAIVDDPEQDKLNVTVTITPPGDAQPLTMKKPEGSNKTYILDLKAPSTPGEYTITFDAVEVEIVPARSSSRSIKLIVVDCGSESDTGGGVQPPPPPAGPGPGAAAGPQAGETGEAEDDEDRDGTAPAEETASTHAGSPFDFYEFCFPQSPHDTGGTTGEQSAGTPTPVTPGSTSTAPTLEEQALGYAIQSEWKWSSKFGFVSNFLTAEYKYGVQTQPADQTNPAASAGNEEAKSEWLGSVGAGYQFGDDRFTQFVAGGGYRYAVDENPNQCLEAKTENLQDIPISVTAFDGDAIEGLTSVEDLANLLPSFNPVDANGQFTFRGAVLSERGQPIPGVSVLTTFDLDAVEVLRGPQAVTFGRTDAQTPNFIRTGRDGRFQVTASDIFFPDNRTSGATEAPATGVPASRVQVLTAYGWQQNWPLRWGDCSPAWGGF